MKLLQDSVWYKKCDYVILTVKNDIPLARGGKMSFFLSFFRFLYFFSQITTKCDFNFWKFSIQNLWSFAVAKEKLWHQVHLFKGYLADFQILKLKINAFYFRHSLWLPENLDFLEDVAALLLRALGVLCNSDDRSCFWCAMLKFWTVFESVKKASGEKLECPLHQRWWWSIHFYFQNCPPRDFKVSKK
jgi:hypothetical protein